MKKYLVTVRHTKTWIKEVEVMCDEASEAEAHVEDLISRGEIDQNDPDFYLEDDFGLTVEDDMTEEVESVTPC